VARFRLFEAVKLRGIFSPYLVDHGTDKLLPTFVVGPPAFEFPQGLDFFTLFGEKFNRFLRLHLRNLFRRDSLSGSRCKDSLAETDVCERCLSVRSRLTSALENAPRNFKEEISAADPTS
jgi:hypothetical protein